MADAEHVLEALQETVFFQNTLIGASFDNLLSLVGRSGVSFHQHNAETHDAKSCVSVEYLTKVRAVSKHVTADFAFLVQLNLSAVRNHYEVQIAAMGIRGVPNEQQAMAGVQKKGTAGLKFKSKPAIAAHAYAEVGIF